MKLFAKIILNNLLNLFFIIFFFIICIDDSLPNILSIESMQRDVYIKIYDKDKYLIAKYGHWQEKMIKAEKLPKILIYALIDTEDKNFFYHIGIDIIAIIRSLALNFISKKIISGASSITQQLAKNILQNEEKITLSDKTLIRKIKELILAFKIERHYSKNQILTFYLNRSYFGSGCYGIYSASINYFDKTPDKLNIYEIAALIGLLKAPSKIKKNQISWRTRTEKVLQLMLRNNHINKVQYNNFKKFKFIEKKDFSKIGYFTDHVISQIPQHLKNRDLIIITTLDSKLQNLANNAIQKTYIDYGKIWNADQCSMVVLDKNGAIRAMIGGLNYYDSQFNRAKAIRSIGSFFKYYIYAYAMQLGLDPESLIDDQELKMGAYMPSNYLHKTIGKIKVKDAFALSVNSTAIMLLMACGIKNIIHFVRKKLGIKQSIQPNPSIAIGGMNASTLELATTMIPIINNGYFANNYCIEEIRDTNGAILYKYRNKFIKILENRTIYYTWNLLKNVTSCGTARSLSTVPNKIIGAKSGTSNEYKDLVLAGATPDYAIAVWWGRDDFTPMNYVPGKHLAVVTTKYFLETLPDNNNDLDIVADQINTLTFEDLLITGG